MVDDEDIVRALVTRSLRDAGYHVLQASHGAAAIELLEAECADVDLVICDLVMPVLGGRDVALWMRQHCPRVPLLFISGYPRSYLEAHDYFYPPSRMLRKPFLPSSLVGGVEERLAPPPRPGHRRAEGG